MSEVEVGAEATEVVPNITELKAQKLIRNLSLWSAGVGLIPVPLVDALGVGGVQVYLIRELTKLYEVPFTRERAKALITAVVGGGVPVLLGGSATSLLAAIPLVGQVLSVAVMPVISGASTLALGRVFNEHLKTGGTLLDFDSEALRTHYQSEFEKAKQEVAEAVSPSTLAA